MPYDGVVFALLLHGYRSGFRGDKLREEHVFEGLVDCYGLPVRQASDAPPFPGLLPSIAWMIKANPFIKRR